MDLDISNADHQPKITEVLDAYLEKKPKINTPLLLLLKIMKADGQNGEFKNRLVKYMRPMVIKGVSSLINGMKWIYE